MQTTTQGAGATVYLKFTTRNTSGVPTALTGGTVNIYKNAATTPSTAGVTLTASFNSVVGLNHISIDTTSDATFYANGNSYQATLSAGTVGGTSVIGEVVGTFDLAAAIATANVTQWNGTNVATPATAGVPDVNVKNINNVAAATPGAVGGLQICGTNVGPTLYTNGVSMSNSSGNGLTLSGGTNGDGLACTGVGTGSGIHAVSVGSGTGINANITGNLTGNVSGSVGSVTGLTNATIDTQLSGTHGAGAWGGGGGGATPTQIWQDLLASGDFDVPGSIGALLVLNIDAQISTRSTYAGGPVASVGAPVSVGGYEAGQDPATLVLDAVQSDHDTPGTIGAAIGRAGSYGIPKNQALAGYEFYMELIDGTPGTGLIVTATHSLDGSLTFTPFANVPIEIGNGWYKIDLETTDTNADTGGYSFVAPGAKSNLQSVVFS